MFKGLATAILVTALGVGGYVGYQIVIEDKGPIITQKVKEKKPFTNDEIFEIWEEQYGKLYKSFEEYIYSEEWNVVEVDKESFAEKNGAVLTDNFIQNESQKFQDRFACECDISPDTIDLSKNVKFEVLENSDTSLVFKGVELNNSIGNPGNRWKIHMKNVGGNWKIDKLDAYSLKPDSEEFTKEEVIEMYTNGSNFSAEFIKEVKDEKGLKAYLVKLSSTVFFDIEEEQAISASDLSFVNYQSKEIIEQEPLATVVIPPSADKPVETPLVDTTAKKDLFSDYQLYVGSSTKSSEVISKFGNPAINIEENGYFIYKYNDADLYVGKESGTLEKVIIEGNTTKNFFSNFDDVENHLNPPNDIKADFFVNEYATEDGYAMKYEDFFSLEIFVFANHPKGEQITKIVLEYKNYF